MKRRYSSAIGGDTEIARSLAETRVIDNHCHPWRLSDLLKADPLAFEDRATLTGMCLLSSKRFESLRERYLESLSDSLIVATTMRRRLARRLGCEATREAVALARQDALSAGPVEYITSLFDEAKVSAIIYDEGYPQPVISQSEFRAESGTKIFRVGRIEPWLESLAHQTRSFDQLLEAFSVKLEEEADSGLVGFKSIVAYRTGLNVGRPSRTECDESFREWKKSAFTSLESSKPVRDYLLHVTLECARRNDRAVHIHCGAGDPDVVLGHARPQDIFPMLVDYADQPIVLIHAGWPWLEEAAHVAAILPNVYLDISLLVPFGTLGIDHKLAFVIGTAPTSRILYGSDEASEPELIWLGAHLARDALCNVLERAVREDWLGESDAIRVGQRILGGNTANLHAI